MAPRPFLGLALVVGVLLMHSADCSEFAPKSTAGGAVGDSYRCTKPSDCPAQQYCDNGDNCYQCSYINPSRCDAVDRECCSAAFLRQCPSNPAGCARPPPPPPPPSPAAEAQCTVYDKSQQSCHWDMMPGVFFTGAGTLYVTTTSVNMEQCRLACCYRKLGCAAFAFDGRAGTPDTCTLWVSIESTVEGIGYISGKITGTNLPAPAGIDPMHPPLLSFCSVSARVLLNLHAETLRRRPMPNTKKLNTVLLTECMQRFRATLRLAWAGSSGSQCAPAWRVASSA